MIDIKHLVQNLERYQEELKKRGGKPEFALQAKNVYESWKEKKATLDILLEKKNEFNKRIGTLSPQERETALKDMKKLSEEIKEKESFLREVSGELTQAISKIPNLTYDDIPVGKSDADNPVIQTW